MAEWMTGTVTVSAGGLSHTDCEEALQAAHSRTNSDSAASLIFISSIKIVLSLVW